MLFRPLAFAAALLGSSCAAQGMRLQDVKVPPELVEHVLRRAGGERDCRECPRGAVCDAETGECVADSELPPPGPRVPRP